ncbi:hypothetical protein C8J56DRAFT_728738, partial [Mycena floridula]
KAECLNCGATHTLLWRPGLNDELNCNACGLYCKLLILLLWYRWSDFFRAQCYNCHTTMTPLWGKDDEGKTVCNVC